MRAIFPLVLLDSPATPSWSHGYASHSVSVCVCVSQHGMILPDKQNLFFQVFFKSNSRTFFR